MKNNKKLLGLLFSLVLVACALLGLVACGDDSCEHSWQDASCTEPKRCSLCSVTEGEAKGHTGGTATCTDKAVCTVCNQAYGSLSASHTFDKETVKAEALKSEASCTSGAVYYKSCVCGEISTNDADTFVSGDPVAHSYTEEVVKAEALKTEASCTSSAVYYKSCKCGMISENETDTFVSGDPIAHSYTVQTATPETLKSEASCQGASVYYKSCACGAISTNDADTFVSGNALTHSYVLETVKDDALKSEASCTSGAVYYKSCSCGAISTNDADTFVSGDPVAHTYDKDVVKDDAFKSEASCTSAAVYYKSCECGAVSESDEDVFTSGSALPHTYEEIDSTGATCTAPATKTYGCSCGAEYTDDVGDALGHNISDVEPSEVPVEGTSCEFTLVYICKRRNCGAEVEGKRVEHHNYVASISKEATCIADGEKTLTCACGDTETEVIEKNETGHVWNKGTVAEGSNTRIDNCTVCEAEKSVTVYTGNKTDEINTSDLKDQEIELNDTNISLDSGVIDSISDEKVTVSADKVEGDDRYDLGLGDKLAQVGDNPIYNFTINDGAVSEFGEENYATITLPYELGENEDVDSIAIWFIDNNGELESIKATYNNGFVTFKTNHFSYYTVTRLKPEERCALYDCSFVTQVEEGSCTKDAYTLYVCVRCHKSEKRDVVEAKGHDYETETVAATCTENGYVEYSCKNCDHSYKTTIRATGHAFEIVDTFEATCTENGYVKYGCANCDSEYTVMGEKAPHVLKDTVNAPTCEAGGYTLHECENCDYSYTDAYLSALGHNYQESEWTWAEGYGSATLKFVCTNNAEHTMELAASITSETVYGTCSDFVKTTYVATVSYEGQTYTNTEVYQVGTPDHSFSADLKYNDTEHWYECVCGEKKDVTAHTFENDTVTKEATCAEKGESVATCACGATKTTELPKTNNHSFEGGVCTVCGRGETGFYINLINSYKDVNGFTLKIENLSYVMNRLKNDSWEMNGNIKQLDVTELYLYIENGELKGAAEGSISIFNGPYDNANAVYNFKAVISEGYVYVSVEFGKENATNTLSLKYSIDSIIKMAVEEMLDMDMEMAEDMSSFLVDTLVPAIDTLIEANSADLDSILESIMNIFFTVTEQANGSYLVSFDYDKLLLLNERIATCTVSELINLYFGEGSFDSVVDEVVEFLGLTASELIDFAKEQGLDLDELIASINELCATMGAPEGFDIGEIIYDDEIADVALGELMFETESFEEKVKEMAADLGESTLYELFDINEALKENVEEIVNMIKDSISLGFTTDTNGALTSVKIGVDSFYYEENKNSMELSVDLSLEINGTIDVAWADIVEDLEDNVVPPTEDMLDTSVDSDNNNYSGIMDYNGEEYNYFAMEYYFTRNNYEKLLGILIGEDCGDWTSYTAIYAVERYSFSIRMLYAQDNQGSSDEGYLLIIDEVSGEIFELEETDTGYKVVYEDGTSVEIGEELLENGEALYEAVFGEPNWTEYIRRNETVSYYYNATTKEYSDDSQHKFEETFEVLGSVCGYDGCVITLTCTECGYVTEETNYHCVCEDVTIDLSEYSTCGGTYEANRCKYCENIYDIYDIDIKCNINEVAEEELFDDDGNSIGYKITSVCADCGLVFIESAWTEYESTCEYYEYECNYIYKGEECIYKYVYRDWEEAHEYEYTYEFENGTDCEGGLRIIYHCKVCDLKETWHTSGHSTESVTINLSDYGTCGGYAYVSRCKACGKITSIHDYESDCNEFVDSVSENIVDSITGEVIGSKQIESCSKCGLVYTSSSWKEYQESCQYKMYYAKSIYVGDECVVDSSSYYYSSSHSFEYTYEMLGTTCDDGYKVTAKCSVCGIVSGGYTSTGHRSSRTDISMEELGFCGGTFRIYTCDICKAVVDSYENSSCWWSYSGENDEGYDMYTCRNCGGTKISGTEYSEKNESCQGTRTSFISYFLDGEEVYKYESVSTYTQHDYEYEFELNGTSCYDGYTVISTCKDCGDTDESEGSGHSKYTVYTFETDESCSEQHDIIIQICPCGYDVNVSLNDYYFSYEDYTCDDCGLTLSHGVDKTEDGCTVTETISILVKLSNVELYSYTKEKLYANHSFNNVELSTVDGVSVLAITCGDCDAKVEGKLLEAVLENHNGEYYYDFEFTPEESGNYTITSLTSGPFVTLYKKVGSQLVSIASPGYSPFRLTEALSAGTTYVYRISTYSNSDIGKTIEFLFLQAADFEGECNHNEYTKFAELFEGSSSCEDGALYGRVYTSCGCISSVYTTTDHETVEKEYYDLEEYGACYGYLRFYSCACGDNAHYDRNLCTWNWTNNEYYNVNGYLVHVRVYTCSDCGLRFTESSYSVRDKETCTEITYTTVAVNIGTSLVVQKEFSNTEESHDYKITGTLNEGSTTCDDGATITYTCKDCDYSYDDSTYWHEQYESEKLELADYGSVCGGYAVVLRCACGLYSNLSIDHSLCDFGTYDCELWIENVITGRQYTINGWWNYYYSDSYIYKCAVTDPEDAACTFNIRYASYWLKDEDSCYAYRYNTYQFGYNEEDGTYQHEVTIKTSEKSTYHSYVTTENDYGVRYDCSDCGSYYYEYNYYNEEGRRTKYEWVGSNTLNDGNNKYYEHVKEYALDADGNTYVCREYEKYIYANGEEYWYENLKSEVAYEGDFGENGREVTSSYINSDGESTKNKYAYVYYKGYEYTIYSYTEKNGGWERYDYSYSFDDGCVRTTVYTNSNGESNTDSEIFCRYPYYNYIDIIAPTCTQEGLRCNECYVCEKQSEPYTVSPYDHNWWGYNDGYICSRCGLENANGASGSIVMEDLTYTYGEGEYYVVGYWARNNVEFTYYVSLIFADDSEIILEGVEFTTIAGVRSVAFSKAAVEELAEALGYAPEDYEVRFSFVPYGADGSFDYGLTFTNVTEVDVITDSISFNDYIDENEVKEYTITPESNGYWSISCETPLYCYAYICDSEGDEYWDYCDYGFNIGCELQAGKTYTLCIENYDSFPRYISLSFVCEPVAE